MRLTPSKIHCRKAAIGVSLPESGRSSLSARCPKESLAKNGSCRSSVGHEQQERTFAIWNPVSRLNGRFPDRSGHWQHRTGLRHPAKCCRPLLCSNFSRQAPSDRDVCPLFGDQIDEGTAANRPTADGLNPRQQPSERPVESAASYLPVADQTATGGFGRGTA